MTATPHAGREEDFQLFMALLDTDRFEGRYRDAVHTVNTDGLMRRMVKEDLKTFEGKPLFPERRAYTVAYELSEDEKDLYEAVTQYVREEMNHADRLKEAGDNKRGFTVGFALTVLQRRLASSPEAILKSLERRHKRLEKRRNEMRYGNIASEDDDLARRLRDLLGKDPTEADLTDLGSDGDDLPGGEAEEIESEVADAATAARTIAELDKELAILADLIELARRVRHSGTDKKWTELRELLTDNTMITGEKIIIFTEHRDTLEYLAERIRDLLGRSDAVVTIHGGVRREERRQGHRAVHPGHRHPGPGRHRRRRRGPEPAARPPHGQLRPAVEPEPDRAALRPHPPHRPDRGLPPVEPRRRPTPARAWSSPAAHQDRGAAQGLPRQGLRRARRGVRGPAAAGPARRGDPLRQPTPRSAPGSTRSSTRPSARAWTSSSPNAPRTPTSSPSRTWRSGAPGWTRRTPAASSRTTSAPSSGEAFKLLGGRMSERESGRYEIRHVPADIRDRDRQTGTSAAPVLAKYERVTFAKELTRPEGKPRADLLAPGHPLLDAVTDLIIERYGTLLKQGTMLADRHDPGTEPRLLVAVTHEITDGHDPARTITKKFGFVEVDAQGPLGVRSAGEARYLDYEPMNDPERTVALPLREVPWLSAGVENVALDWAVTEGMPEELARTRDLVTARVAQVRRLVKQRLTGEINYWDMRHAELLDAASAGRSLKMKPETAYNRARDLERRLEKRLADLDRDEELIARPPAISAAALVVPQGLLNQLLGDSGRGLLPSGDTTATERRAVDAVLAAERRLGRVPREMPHNNPGYDIESRRPDGHIIFIEVKGRVAGAEEFWVTRTEALHGKNSATGFRLAMVSVHPAGPESDAVRYIVDPFRDVDFGDFAATGMIGNWLKEWERGVDPV